MQTVNFWLLNDLLSPLGGTGDIDRTIDHYRNFNSNDQTAVKEVILAEIKPYYLLASDTYKNAVKRTLSYYLTTGRLDFGELYDNCLIAFDHPLDPRDFFIWIWEVLFPDEGHRMTNVND